MLTETEVGTRNKEHFQFRFLSFEALFRTQALQTCCELEHEQLNSEHSAEVSGKRRLRGNLRFYSKPAMDMVLHAYTERPLLVQLTAGVYYSIAT